MTRVLVVDVDDREQLAALAERLRPFLMSSESEAGRLLTVAEAAGRLGVHRKTLERWCRDGRIAGAVKVGRGWRLPVVALDDFATAPPDARPTRPARRPRRSTDAMNRAAADAISPFPS